MSTEEVTSRKAKKAQRDAQRKKAGKKRKREEVEEQTKGEGDELKQDFTPLAGGDEATIARDSTALTKKRKTAASSSEEQGAAPEEPGATKSKKRRKTKSSASVADEGTAKAPAAETPEGSKDGVDASSARPTKSRFILFIGNLPYSATDESITAHFKSIQPFTLRHRVDPKTKKSKGFAFLEFENYDRMKTCLKLYHHSTFDPTAQQSNGEDDGDTKHKKGGKKGKDNSRKINVELTAGGGGKGEDRKEKIKVKNAKLEEERKRRREAEEKAELRREKKGKGKKITGGNAVEAGKDGDGEKVKEPEAGEGMQGVHPSRLARMKT